MISYSDSEIRESVETCIKRLIENFGDYPFLYYTEQDFHCHLYSELLKVDSLRKKHEMGGGGVSLLVHKEYPTEKIKVKISGETKRVTKDHYESLKRKHDIRGSREAYDLSVFKPGDLNIFDFKKKDDVDPVKPLVAIEVALDYGPGHFEKDYRKIVENNVPQGYIVHLMRDKNLSSERKNKLVKKIREVKREDKVRVYENLLGRE